MRSQSQLITLVITALAFVFFSESRRPPEGSPARAAEASIPAETSNPDPVDEVFPDPTWVSLDPEPTVDPAPEVPVKVEEKPVAKPTVKPALPAVPKATAPRAAAPVAPTGQWIQQRRGFGRRSRAVYVPNMQSCASGNCR